MALQKQLVQIPLRGGIDTEGDDYLPDEKNLAVLENAFFDDQDTVKIRGGQATVTTPPGMTVPVLRSFQHKGAPIAECEDGTCWPLPRSGLSNAVQVGVSAPTSQPLEFPRTAVVTRRVQRVSRFMSGAGAPRHIGNFDACFSTDRQTYCLAWEYETDYGICGVGVSLRDAATDKELLGFQMADGVFGTENYCKPRVVYSATSSSFSVFVAQYTTGSTDYEILASYFLASGAAAPSTASVLSVVGGNTVESASQYEVLFDVSDFVAQGPSPMLCTVAARDTNGDVLTVAVDDVNTVTFGPHTSTPSSAISGLAAFGQVASTSDYRRYVVYTHGTQAHGRYADDVNPHSAEVAVGPTARGGAITCCADPDSVTGEILVALDDTPATPTSSKNSTVFVRVTEALAAVSDMTILVSGFLAGRMVPDSISQNSPLLLPVWVSSNIDDSPGTYLVLDARRLLNSAGRSTATPVARLAYGEAAGLPYVETAGSNGAVLARRLPASPSYLRHETDLYLAGGDNETPVAIELAEFDTYSQLSAVEVNGVTVLAGACPLIYDGVDIVEEGWHTPPGVIGVAYAGAPSGTAGIVNLGPIPMGATDSYTVYFTETWVDAAGNLHESAPSDAYLLQGTAGNTYAQIKVLRPPSLRYGFRQLRCYRTLDNSLDTTAYTAFKDDGTAITDTDLAAGEALNLTVAANTPCPPCRHLSVFQNRLVATGCGDGSRIYWTKELAQGFAPEFASGDLPFSARLPSSFGKGVASVEQDGKLVVLGEHRVGVLYGQGPDDSGQGEYSRIETVAGDVGAWWDAPGAVGTGPEGVWFQSTRGIRLLTRGGQVVNAGAAVDSMLQNVPALYVSGDTKQQIWFFTTGDYTLVWDTRFRQWSRMTNFVARAAEHAGGRLTVFDYDNNAVIQYSETECTDKAGAVAQEISATLLTNWIQLAGIQGFQRVYSVGVLAREVPAAGGFQWTAVLSSGVDFSDTLADTLSYTASPTPLFQFRHHVKNQKCQSFRVQLVWGLGPEQSVIWTQGRLRISGLTLEIGVKQGTFKNTARF